MKDHRHVLGRLAELAQILERNRRTAADAIDRLSASNRDEDAVVETIAMMEDVNDELEEARTISQTILETLSDEEPQEDEEGDVPSER